MFEFARELKRIFRVDSRLSTPRVGLAGGDPALLELLNLALLKAEGEAVDAAVLHAAVAQRPAQRLIQSAVWREMARRTGSPEALRKAASAAELALTGIDRRAQAELWAQARGQQAECAMLGAELFGDDGLNAAADLALAEARTAAGGSVAGAIAVVAQALLEARTGAAAVDAAQARKAVARFDGAVTALDAWARHRGSGRLPAAWAHAARADLLGDYAVRLGDAQLFDQALTELGSALGPLDPAYEPLTWARLTAVRGRLMTQLGQVTQDVTMVADGVDLMTTVFGRLSPDHSPLDWARAQRALGLGLWALADLTDSGKAFEHALTCFDRALVLLKAEPSLTLRATAAGERGACLARHAEVCGDRGLLDGAEAALRCELAAEDPARDPVGWAVRQVNLARVYEARADLGCDGSAERDRAAAALCGALDVFTEHGLRGLADLTVEGLERLRAARPQGSSHGDRP